MNNLSNYNREAALIRRGVVYSIENTRKHFKGLVYSDIVLRSEETGNEMHRESVKRQSIENGSICAIQECEFDLALMNYQLNCTK